MDFLNELANYPIISRFKKNMEYLNNGLVKGIVTLKVNEVFIENLYEKYVKGHEDEDIIHCGAGEFMQTIEPYFLFVDKIFLQDRVLEYTSLEKLREPLKNKKNKFVWCKTAGSYQEMMSRRPNYYVVTDTNELPTDNGRRSGEYKRVANQETNLLELIAFHYKYSFDESQDMFIKVSEAEQYRNLNKPWVEHEIKRESGNDSSRLADYGRLIRFLLAKVNLSADEKNLFSDILGNPVSALELENILSREKKVMNKVIAYKKGEL